MKNKMIIVTEVMNIIQQISIAYIMINLMK